jgi:hypothetical protein
MAEFCPKCGTPLDDSGDECRYCDTCGWFGDNGETAKTPPPSNQFSPVQAVLQALALFRDVCRKELRAEQVFNTGNVSDAKLRAIKMEARSCLHSLVELFTAMRRPHAPPPVVLKTASSNMVPWPAEWTDYHYNASHEPCDMLVGPCSCGAWHHATEEWVRETLARHNTVIQ